MSTAQYAYLPTEILVHILSYIAADSHDARRQRSLYTCCLINHQWYSAAVAFLYERPCLDVGISFKKFTATVSPSIGARKSKYNLGSFVRRLDLSSLVHDSSNSLTARLIGRVKENLEVFIAPRVSFAINSLPSLSKCVNLRHLDLSMVGDPIPFQHMKKTLNHLTKLITLRLPQSTSITTPESLETSMEWPPLLERLQLSGRFSPTLIPYWRPPPRLTSLTLENCADLSIESFTSLIGNPYISHHLKRLKISGINRGLQPESICAIPSFLPELVFLSVPGNLVETTFFDILHLTGPLALEVLELGYPYSENLLKFDTADLVTALETDLPNLCALGFSEVFRKTRRLAEDEMVEDILLERDNKQFIPRGVEEDDPDDLEDVYVGIYYV